MVLSPGELLLVLPEQLPLNAKLFRFTLIPPQELEEPVQGADHTVDGARGVALLQKAVPPLGGALWEEGGVPQPPGKGPNVAKVVFYGAGGAVGGLQSLGKACCLFRGDGSFHEIHSFLL